MPVRCTSIEKPPGARGAAVRRLDVADDDRYPRLIENTRSDALVVRRLGDSNPLLQVNCADRRVVIGTPIVSSVLATFGVAADSTSAYLGVLTAQYTHAGTPSIGPVGIGFTMLKEGNPPTKAVTWTGGNYLATITSGDGGFAQTMIGFWGRVSLLNSGKTWTGGVTHKLYGARFSASVTNMSGVIASNIDAISAYFDNPTGSISGTYKKRAAYFAGDIELANGMHLHLATGTGTKIGTAVDQKLGFFGATPVVQRAANADTNGAALGELETEVNEIKQVLRDLGLIAT